MQLDFHYYATYCAACIAGYSHEESLDIAYSAQFTDCCSRTMLKKIKAPLQAATTQLQLELMDARTDPQGLQDITRIWASFHFLPADLYAKPERRCSRRYLRKYRMICGPDSELVANTVDLARGTSLQSAGIAMHVLADTWAHRYFAGTPSLVINNTSYHFYEIIRDGDSSAERRISFNHNPATEDVPEEGIYTNSMFQSSENSIMNLGHGRAGHLPDYCWARYRYLPAWGDYREIIKDNPSDYYNAFCQMVYAMQYLRGDIDSFETKHYAYEAVLPWKDRITEILEKRQLDSSEDWRELGAEISGHRIEAFDIDKYQDEYIQAAEEDKDQTFIGRFLLAALEQKSMVTNRIFVSGNTVAGVSVDFSKRGFKGIKDFRMLVEERTDQAQK